MSDTPRKSGEAFALERLQDDPELAYETLRQQAEQAGIFVQPIQYGRARRQLGLTGSPPTQAKQAHAEQAEGAAMPQTTAGPAAPRQHDAAKPPQPAGNQPRPAATPAKPAPAAKPPAAAAKAGGDGPPPGLTRKSTPAFEFLVESLQADATLSFGELKERAVARGLKIAPIMYGRAKALLGLVPVRPRGQGKNRKAQAKKSEPAKPDAAPAAPIGEQLDGVRDVDDLVRIVKLLDAERRRLRKLLEHIADSIDAALDYSDDEPGSR